MFFAGDANGLSMSLKDNIPRNNGAFWAELTSRKTPTTQTQRRTRRWFHTQRVSLFLFVQSPGRAVTSVVAAS